MRTGKLILENIVFTDYVEIASGFFERLRGLLGRKEMLPGSAMIIERCGAVHTVGMRFPLDLIFLDKNWYVLVVKRNVKPGCLIVSGGIRACRVIESQAGILDLSEVEGGRQFVFSPY